MKKLMALTALTAILTACDSAERSDLHRERGDRLYQSAMDDYRSGRIDAAIKGFESVIRKDPANASARFQLACLQQDVKHDYLEAFLGYREYLLQCPKSDKAALVRNRSAICEKELAKTLAVRYGFAGAEGFAKELETVRLELKTAKADLSSARKELDEARLQVASLTSERARLVALVKNADGDGRSVGPTGDSLTREAADLLNESEEEEDRIKTSKDAAALIREGTDELSAGSDLLSPRTDKPVTTNAVASTEKPSGKKVPDHPETYVVEDGDTLYGIAKRFYGRVSAWKAIREANKGLIPADNRLRAGDTLRLP